MKKFNFEFIDTPISDRQKTEQVYRKHRESKISFIEFKCPKYQGCVYDFTIDNFKIQEKVGAQSKGKDFIVFSLHKNNGKTDGKRQLTSYKKGENDFYCLNLPDKKHFYVIPEQILIDQKYIDILNTKTFTVNANTKSWASPYKFEYDNLDEDKLKAVFSKQKKED